MKRGLVLGKFAPLHKGHQLLIETALAGVDELVVLIYESRDVTRIPLSVRANWIRQLYPRAVVVEGYHGPNGTARNPVFMRVQERYILSMMPGPITHFYSSEWYGAHVSEALGALNMQVDPARIRLPISATMIRGNEFAHRQYLHPIVYRDLIPKVVFLGAESTGKSTLAAAMAARFSTRHQPEFGREYWKQHHAPDGTLTPAQLADLAREHLRWEDEVALECNRLQFVDTSALTTAMYSKRFHGTIDPELARLAQSAESRYALTFLCGDDIPFIQDGTRYSAEERARHQQAIQADLEARGVSYHRVTGPLPKRIDEVQRLIWKNLRIALA